MEDDRNSKPGDKCYFCEEGTFIEAKSLQWITERATNGKVMVEIPCLTCDKCREEIFVGEKIDNLVESGFIIGDKTPLRVEQIPVYAME